MLAALTALAAVQAQAGDPAGAITLLAAVLVHPAGERYVLTRAAQLQAELAASLPTATVAAARTQGQTRPLAALVAAALADDRQGTRDAG